MDDGRYRFEIAATYRCNQNCKWCNRYLDVTGMRAWSNSDIHPADVRDAGKLVAGDGIQIHKLRVTGGEPCLHGDLYKVCLAGSECWHPVRLSVVMTNHSLPKPTLPMGWRYCKSKPTQEQKEDLHRPWTISPLDLGLEAVDGVQNECGSQNACGRLFDAYGFACCVYAGAMGRVLRIDPYSAKPVLRGREDLCKHCMYSLPRNRRNRLWADARKGMVDFPTRTYREGIEAFRKRPFAFKRWRER